MSVSKDHFTEADYKSYIPINHLENKIMEVIHMRELLPSEVDGAIYHFLGETGSIWHLTLFDNNFVGKH